MYYTVENVSKSINKKRLRIDRILIIIILLLVILLCVYAGRQCGIYYNSAKYAEEIEYKFNEFEKIKNEEQEKQRQLEEERKQKAAQLLTPEQLENAKNIYESEEKRVFLTFDDGPSTSVTPFILDLLQQENIKATFFVLGDRAVVNPELVKREYDEGHYIANHGKTHIYSQIYSSAESVLDEYNYTNELIRNAIENQEYNCKFFRFPGGSAGGYYSEIKNQAIELLNQNGIASIDWNSLSRDAEGAKTIEDLVQNTIITIGEKQSVVILMHDASNKILTYEALPQIIQYLKDNGYSFKTMYDLL